MSQYYVDIMKNKAQELEVRNIMEGLEEFANFMSFRSNTTGLRVLSVETVEQDIENKQMHNKATVSDIRQRADRTHSSTQQTLNKSLVFSDQQQVH